MTKATSHRSIRLFDGGFQPCPYLDDRMSRFDVVDPRLDCTPALYDELLAAGFRRGGEHIYRTGCPGCQACESLRIPVTAFAPRRRHRRCLRRNRDIRLVNAGFRHNPEHFALYQRYVNARHPGGGMDDVDVDMYRQFLTAPWCPTDFLEMRQSDTDELLGVAVTDDTGHSLSAVYTFYAPEAAHRGLGTLAILLQIDEARRRQRDWLYLGYWIGAAPRMDYKRHFTPHERYIQGQWQRFPAL